MGRTSFLAPSSKKNEAYFFHGTKYARVYFVPSSPTEEITYGPASVAKEWKTLVEAGFDTVDAALPVPGHDGEVYFFSGVNYVKIRFTPGTPDERITFGPRKIADKWKTLAQAGFETVDAVLPVPGVENEAYFFNGNRYVKIRFTPGSADEQIVYGPANIADEWKTLAKAGFSTIDSALPVPDQSGEAYFFSGSQYVKIKFVQGSPTEEILYGPTSITKEWKSLSWGW
ncbi:Hemopexin-like domain-containing protein [Lasiosphaeria miniovina]|uniref:Hemopexin-like domain-containing protein n=2 Tax=Lasiosphaeria TaxID=92901 RepID=A0AA40AE24_9PEZI|nr:Hemopexin-like domain-containing protein [Lasiosphaeria miniovina]KAK0714115.1 Hemopexin-like domain-containing protein [Lasiosphaeria miniovina]KAK3361816.1 Hemopexin-like domain-containing protein [Lasiosphaeria ovina]